MSAGVKFSSYIGPVRCDEVDRSTLIEALSKEQSFPTAVFFNVNAHAVNLALSDPEFAEALNSSSMTFCDGFGVIQLDRIFGKGRLRARATPPDFMDEVFRKMHAVQQRAFFVGDEGHNVNRYAQEVNRRYPGLVVGCHHGYFSLHSGEEKRLIERISELKVDLLLVGMGMPRQEFWIKRNLFRLRCKKALSVGALFAWGKGRRRGPRWLTDRGGEWLFRLASEPQRVWRRYLFGLPQVVWRMLLFKIKERRYAGYE